MARALAIRLENYFKSRDLVERSWHGSVSKEDRAENEYSFGIPAYSRSCQALALSSWKVADKIRS